MIGQWENVQSYALWGSWKFGIIGKVVKVNGSEHSETQSTLHHGYMMEWNRRMYVLVKFN